MGAGLCLVAMTMMAVARAGVGVGDRHSVRMVGEPPSAEERGTTTTTVVPSFGGDPGTFPTLPWSGHSFDGDWSHLRAGRGCPAVDPKAPPLKVLAGTGSLDSQPFDAVDSLFDAVNKAGGVCGRVVHLVRGNVDTADLSKYVAVLGMPLDDNLDAAIANGRIARSGIPVVSGDGLSQAQHRTRGVYPVGPSASAMARTATAHAKARGAKSFAIVYDANRTFGREAAESFDRYVRQDGGTVKASVALDPSANAYAPQVDRFTSACGVDGCDFVLLALLPETAQKWLATNPVKPRMQLAGLSTVLADGFTDHCMASSDRSCDGLVAWSGYVPRTGAQYWNAEAGYAYGYSNGSALRQGAVVAARVLYEALTVAGPHATSASLRRTLDAITFTSGITPALSWPRSTSVSQAWTLRSGGLVPRTSNPTAVNEAGTHAVEGPQWYPVGTGWVRTPG